MLQMLYAFMGIMYNVGSMMALRTGLQAWASTDALLGLVAMLVYGLLLCTGLLKNLLVYRILMGISVLLLGYSGVLSHLLNVGHLELYQSVWTWMAAIAINSFGWSLNLLAALGRFQLLR